MIHPSKKIACACPLNGKICTDGVREDFPENPAKPGQKVQCRWWQHIYGKDPQTETMIDEFDCSIPWLTVTTIETSQNARGAAMSSDKVANEVAALKTNINSLAGAIRIAAADIRTGIEAGSVSIMLPPGTKNGEEKPDAK